MLCFKSGCCRIGVPWFFASVLLFPAYFKAICDANNDTVWDFVRAHGSDSDTHFDSNYWDFDVFRSFVDLVPSVRSTLQTRSQFTLILPNDGACIQTANDVIALTNETATTNNPVNTEQHAFISLQRTWLDRYENTTEALELWLNYHILTTPHTFEGILELGAFKFKTLAGQDLAVHITKLAHNDNRLPHAELAFAPQSQPAIQPSNGYVVVVDRMLFPSFAQLTLKPNSTDLLPSPPPSPSSSQEPIRRVTPTPTPKPSKSKRPSASATPIPKSSSQPACFPGSSTVHLQGGRSQLLSSLKAGQVVWVSDESTSEVYLFSHRSRYGLYTFLQITTELNHTIELTHGHYIYANGRRVAAHVLRTGDMLRTLDGPSRVRTIRSVRRQGLIAPHTFHGDIVVNRIIASTYTTAFSPWFAHTVLLPIRFLARIGVSLEPLGSTLYSGGPIAVTQWLPSGPSIW